MNETRVPFLDLGRQYRRDRDEIDRAVARVLASGWYILGAELAAFEEEFAAYCGVRHAVGVASGTDAIHLALRACDVGPGDTVVTTPLTAVPTVSTIVASGATPALVDIDASTYTIDPERLRPYLEASGRADRVKAIIAVHLYGHMADMPALRAIADEHGIRLLGDAAQAHGAEYAGKKAGALADLGCFSFYPTKNLGAMGDAGMVVTDDEALADRVRMLRNYGEESKYRVRISGFNSRLDELQAAILRAKLGHLDAWNARRRHLAGLYAELLDGTPLVLPVERPPARHCYHLHVVRTPRRDALRDHLESRGIGTCVHYPLPIHLQAAYRGLGYAPGDLPRAEAACREILSLPLHPELEEAEVRATCAAIVEFFDRGAVASPRRAASSRE